MLSPAGVVAEMNLSKIYRGEEVANLKSFQFLSFGTLPEDASSGSAAGAAEIGSAQPAEPVGAEAIAGHTAQEVEEAYARGYQEALEGAGQRLESATQALAAALDDVGRLRETLTRNSKQDMLRLVMTVAEQVIREQAAVDGKVVLNVIENALHEAVRSDHYRIFVNPQDLAAVVEQKPLFLTSISGLKNVHVEADETITTGGCRVDSEFGAVDATLETQLATIRAALHEALSS